MTRGVSLATSWATAALRRNAFFLLFSLFIPAALISFGLGFIPSVAATLAVLIQVATGSILWVLIRSQGSVSQVQLVGMGLAIGTALTVMGSQVFLLLGMPSIGWFMPAVVVMAVAVLSRSSRRRLREQAVLAPSGAELALLAGTLVVGALIVVPYVLRHPLEWDGWWAYDADTHYHEALTQWIPLYGSSANPMVAGSSIRYHWFTHAWAGTTSLAAGLDPYEAVTRLVPTLSILGIVTLGWSMVRALTAHRLAAAVAVAMLLVSTDVGTRGVNALIFPESPSQTFAGIWLMATMVLIIEQLRGALGRTWPVLSLLTAASLGGKGTAVVLVVGVVFAMVLFWGRARIRRALAQDVLVMGIVSVLMVVFVLSGASNGLEFGLTQMTRAHGFGPAEGLPGGFVFALLVVILAVAAPWSGLIPGLLANKVATRAVMVTGLATGVVGLSLSIVLEQAGHSQLYFLSSAAYIVVPLSAAGIFLPGKCGPPPRRHLLVLGLVGLGLGAASGLLASRIPASTNWAIPLAVWIVVIGFAACLALSPSSGRRDHWMMRLSRLVAVGLVAASLTTGLTWRVTTVASTSEPRFTQSSNLAWTQDHRTALLWLRDHAPDGDLVATNRFCVTASEEPPECFSSLLLVAALSGHQMLIEGYDYSVGFDNLPDEILDRISLSIRFGEKPNTPDAVSLWDERVRWVYIDKAVTAKRSWEPWATVAFENERAIILQLHDPGI